MHGRFWVHTTFTNDEDETFASCRAKKKTIATNLIFIFFGFLCKACVTLIL
jgi:hypothetical protein